MTPPNKPEWMELADADSVPQVKRSTRALPVIVLAVALSIGGIGILFAQDGTEAPASAEVQNMAATASSSPTLQSTKSAVNSAPMTNNPSAPTSIANPSAPKKTGIAAMPTGGGDDEEDDHKVRGSRDDEEDEGDDD
jgi:hypothetical protein